MGFCQPPLAAAEAREDPLAVAGGPVAGATALAAGPLAVAVALLPGNRPVGFLLGALAGRVRALPERGPAEAGLRGCVPCIALLSSDRTSAMAALLVQYSSEGRMPKGAHWPVVLYLKGRKGGGVKGPILTVIIVSCVLQIYMLEYLVRIRTTAPRLACAMGYFGLLFP